MPDTAAQFTIDDAIRAGEAGMATSLAAATRRDPDFSAKAERAILAHLAASPMYQAPGEVLTNVARAHGAIPKDDRAFGAVFQRLARRGLIRTVGYCLRHKGHGTAGGRVWALAQ